MKKISALIILFFILFTSAQAQTVKTIWLVRHAEKLTDNPKDADPNLSEKGFTRAKDLGKYLAKKNIAQIFSTPYLRTKNTAESLAKNLGIGIETYNTKNNFEFAEKLKSSGYNNILVVGHSNTVLEIAKYLGAKTLLTILKDEDYDFIFEVIIRQDRVAIKTHHFGAKHHLSEIK